MIREFGADLFDPATVLRGRLGEGWVEVVREGHVARINLDAAGVAALREWMAAPRWEARWYMTPSTEAT